MKWSNLKMANYNFIKLTKEIDKDGNPVEETYVTPAFIPFRMLYEATDIMAGLEEKSEREAMDIMLDFVVKIYQEKFSKEDLLNGLSAPDAVAEIQSQIEFVASGQIAEDRKKELKKILK
jgi:hypothetical protein